MPGTCSICGESRVEREAAHGSKYVGACRTCREEFEHPGRHVDTCSRDDCVVCADHAEEFGR